MRFFLIAIAALTASLGLAGCDAADRAALTGAKPPASITAQAPTPMSMPPAADHALLFPPAARLGLASTPSHRLTSHRHLVRVSAARRHATIQRRFRRASYVEQTVTPAAYGEEYQAYDHQVRRRVEAEARWDERRSAYAEGYGPDGNGRDNVWAQDAPTAAGRDRDGFLTWPGKIPGRR